MGAAVVTADARAWDLGAEGPLTAHYPPPVHRRRTGLWSIPQRRFVGRERDSRRAVSKVYLHGHAAGDLYEPRISDPVWRPA